MVTPVPNDVRTRWILCENYHRWSGRIKVNRHDPIKRDISYEIWRRELLMVTRHLGIPRSECSAGSCTQHHHILQPGLVQGKSAICQSPTADGYHIISYDLWHHDKHPEDNLYANEWHICGLDYLPALPLEPCHFKVIHLRYTLPIRRTSQTELCLPSCIHSKWHKIDSEK